MRKLTLETLVSLDGFLEGNNELEYAHIHVHPVVLGGGEALLASRVRTIPAFSRVARCSGAV